MSVFFLSFYDHIYVVSGTQRSPLFLIVPFVRRRCSSSATWLGLILTNGRPTNQAGSHLAWTKPANTITASREPRAESNEPWRPPEERRTSRWPLSFLKRPWNHFSRKKGEEKDEERLCDPDIYVLVYVSSTLYDLCCSSVNKGTYTLYVIWLASPPPDKSISSTFSTT